MQIVKALFLASKMTTHVYRLCLTGTLIYQMARGKNKKWKTKDFSRTPHYLKNSTDRRR